MKFELVLASLASAAAAQELCGQYEYYSSSGYGFNNNAWGQDDATSGSQCTTVDGADSGGISWHASWSWSGGDTYVKSYPYGGRDVTSGQLVSDISSMSTAAEWEYDGSDLKADVAYDIFTAADPNHAAGSGDYELMIWLAKIGDVSPIGDSVGTVTVDGKDWDLHIGDNAGMTVFSFVAPTQLKQFDTDAKAFFSYMSDNHGFPADGQYLLTFQFGTEPFTGSDATFTVKHWDGTVE